MELPPPNMNPHRDNELRHGKAAQIEYGETKVAKREESAAYDDMKHFTTVLCYNIANGQLLDMLTNDLEAQDHHQLKRTTIMIFKRTTNGWWIHLNGLVLTTLKT